MSQITTVTFFNLGSATNKFWGLAQMGVGLNKIAKTPGLILSKMMGSGDGNGFSLKPDFSTYALIAIWESHKKAKLFFSHHKFVSDYRQKAKKITTYFIRAHKAHGLWNGIQPFELNGNYQKDKAIIVLTRAKIKKRKLIQFWKSVPSVSKSMEGAGGLIFSKGIGELPLIFQATVSEWSSREDMVNFAYRNPKHAEVIKKTRELKWYSEELFAEFELVEKVIHHDANLPI